MNEELLERFRRGRRGRRGGSPVHTSRTEMSVTPSKLNTRIREYYSGKPVKSTGWLSRPELPTSAEVMDTDSIGGSSSNPEIVEIAPNRPIGPFKCKETYLETHFELLREDAVKPIRDAVSSLRNKPAATENTFDDLIGIYDKVHICGLSTSTRGIATRVTFSLFRTGKTILWEQSKRLISGSLVVLSPKIDMYRTKAIVAIVAARPLEGLRENPPEIDLFFARMEELEIDPAVDYIMIEQRSSFFEADRHTLLALQHMMEEPFPLSEHLVKVNTDVTAPPQHLLINPKRNLSPIFDNKKPGTCQTYNVLKDWPMESSDCDMDNYQLQAVRSILTKPLALIHGPPGTGKTFVSVQAIKVMLANRRENDPPIIVACQTNHAIDQFLRHIANFEENFVRLGGRSTDRDVVKKRTMHEVRRKTSENPPPGWSAGTAKKKMDALERDIRSLLIPLKPDKKCLNHRSLENYKLLTKQQADSLELGASRWVQDKKSDVHEGVLPFTVWLGEKLTPVPPKQQAEDFGFDFEEADLDYEQLQALEAENSAQDDQDFESLHGNLHPLADNFTCHVGPGMHSMLDKVKKILYQEQDMWRVPERFRPAIYWYLQAEQKRFILTELRKKAFAYNEQAFQRKLGYWEKDENILKQQRLIGMTTTGFSKYRALISALQPRIVLIEEAAEVLEAPVAVSCIPSLQQLILVGDHRQLRPHAHVKALEEAPYFFSVSLFERLICNGFQHDVLIKQRRMIPEIRRILCPIYKNIITDHPSVLDPAIRPNVPGMGGVNSFFFSHEWTEQRDERQSYYNPAEIDMIVGFFIYLRHNGVKVGEITILTFYNGQRKRLLANLRTRIPPQDSQEVKVATVDSYQGEENKVVLLSLVRSNSNKQIGFLNVDNRICVALSRAQCGLYIFGNGSLMYRSSETWENVIKIMTARKNKKEAPKIMRSRLGDHLPVCCSNHNRTTRIRHAQGWENLNGGCSDPCDKTLPCGHRCELNCHPFSHDAVNCQQCFRDRVQVNAVLPDSSALNTHPRPSATSAASTKTCTSFWQSFASREEKRKHDLIENYRPPSGQQLIDLSSVQHEIQALQAQSSGTPYAISECPRRYPKTADIKAMETLRSPNPFIQSDPGTAVRRKWKETYKIEDTSEFRSTAEAVTAVEEDLIDLSGD